MRLGRIRRAVLVFSSVLICLIAAVPSRARQGSRDTSQRNERAVLRYLGPAIASTGKGAWLYYQGICRERDGYTVAFPHVDVQPPSKGATGLAAIQQMFGNDKNVKVMEERSGMIRIRIGNAPSTILQTKIGYLALGPLARDFPKWTIYRIERAKEVEAAMRRLNVKPAPFSPGLVSVAVPPGTPHLPSSMRNVTVEQALDLTAETFKGIVIYGACTQPSGQRLFRLDFVDVAGGALSSP